MWDGVKKFQGLLVGWVGRFQCMCECGGMYHRCISGWVGDGKISVLCVGGTWYLCPGVKVVLRLQEPCLGGGEGEISCPVCCRMEDSRVLLYGGQ